MKSEKASLEMTSVKKNVKIMDQEKKTNNEAEELLYHTDETSRIRTSVMAYCKNCCTVKTLKKRIPIIHWLPLYNLSNLKGDVVAGFTVALTVIPQGLALAQLANLPPQYGLYTAFMGCFMYMIFGSCKDLTIGPTAVMSLMTAEHTNNGGVPYVILMTFLCGCIQFIMGILHLGFLINFISAPVISGFTSAAAITIATTQLSGLLGVKMKSRGFIDTIYKLCTNLHKTNLWDAIMGIICIILLLLLKYFKDLKFNEESALSQKFRKCIETGWWLVTTGRNALIVLLCGGLTAILLIYNISPLTLTRVIDAGLPPFNVPSFSIDVFNNSTNKTEHRDFIRIIQDFGSGLIIIPLISILEAIAIAKAFAKGRKLDATQEMIALGICNVMGSFVSSYPGTGSFSRTAINYSSGVKTPFGGVFTGSTVILALCVLSPYFHYIPKASLSAIIFVAVLHMVRYKDIPMMWRTKKLDFVSFLGTFICSFLLGLEYGIIIGIGLSLIMLLFHEATPKITIIQKVTLHGYRYLFVKPDRTAFFPASDLFTSTIAKNIPDNMGERNVYTVVIDGEYIIDVDYSMALSIKNMIENYNKENIITIFVNTNQNVIRKLKRAIPSVFHYCESEMQIEDLIPVSDCLEEVVEYSDNMIVNEK